MHPGILVGAGFLLGTVGVKAAASKPARKACVKGIVCAMRAKESVETVVDEAKAEFDDLMAEAGYACADNGVEALAADDEAADEDAASPAAEAVAE